ncbi:hypothetical protein OXX69_003246 [Metschnikowia pulcherrima]
MKVLSLLLSFCFLLNLGSAFFANSFKPSKDPFYKAPPDIASYKEGEIIRWRDTPRRIRSLFVPNFRVQSAWQYMVKSTDTHGQPIGIVATLLEPKNADTSKLVAYNYWQDSACVDCAPSYSILFGAGVATVSTQIETIIMDQALARGWYVVATDYEGPNAAFGASVLGGQAVLDAIRGALKSSDKSKLKADAKVAIWGYSGGTIPSSWAGTLQPKYAPELSENLIGVAVGGWATNFTSVIETIDGTMWSGLVGAGVLGITTEYPEIKKDLFNHVGPWHVRRLKKLYDKCLVGTLLAYFQADFFRSRSPIFTEGYAFFKRPEIKTVMDDNTLALDNTRPIPEVPFFVYHGEKDELVPFNNSQRVYDMWCSQGIKSMEFAVSKTSDHTRELLQGMGAALSWLTMRFKGDAPVKGCVRIVRNSNWDYPDANTEANREASASLEKAIQHVIGPFKSGKKDEKDAESSLNAVLDEQAKAAPEEAKADPGEEPLEAPGNPASDEPEESPESPKSPEHTEAEDPTKSGKDTV